MINAISILIIIMTYNEFLIIWLGLFAWRCFGQIYYHNTYSKASFILAPNLFTHFAMLYITVNEVLPQFSFIFSGLNFFSALYILVFVSTFFELCWHGLLTKLRYAPPELDILSPPEKEITEKNIQNRKKYFSIMAHFFIFSISFIISTLIYFFIPSTGVVVFQLVDLSAIAIFLFSSLINLLLSFFIFRRMKFFQKGGDVS